MSGGKGGGISVNPLKSIFAVAAADQAGTAERNALREQEQAYSNQAIERERKLKKDLDVFKRQSEQAFGDSVSSFAKAGVDVSGSPLIVLAGDKAEYQTQLNEIQRAGTIEAAGFRSAADDARARRRASLRNSDFNNITTFLTSIG